MALVATAFTPHLCTMTPKNQPEPFEKNHPDWRRIAIWMCIFGIAFAALHFGLSWAMNFVSASNSIAGSMPMVGFLAISLVVYAILIATPFMPGIEVGVALLLLQGADVAPFVYLATVVGLMTAYLIGNTISLPRLQKFFGYLGLQKVSTYLAKIETTTPADRLAAQRALLPTWLANVTTNYRYIMIAVLLNIPGTFAIGGGGGILMAAGFSRLFGSWAMFGTVLLAVLPVPLVVWVLGVSVIGG